MCLLVLCLMFLSYFLSLCLFVLLLKDFSNINIIFRAIEVTSMKSHSSDSKKFHPDQIPGEERGHRMMSESESMSHFSELHRVIDILHFCSYKSSAFDLPSEVLSVFSAPSCPQVLSHLSPHLILTPTPFSRQELRLR